jgi:hypothetical protein
VRPSAETTLEPLSEDEMAAWRRDQGLHVVRHRGRWWWEAKRGFYRPIHMLARLHANEATRPVAACWGFHATIRDEDAAEANTALPTHRITRLDDWEEDKLSSNRRYELRKARRTAELVELTEPDLLLEQGYELLRQTIERTGWGRLPSREQYERDARTSVRPGRRLVLAGLIEGRLAGYAECYGVDGVGYYDEMRVANDALETNLSKALQVEFILACRRSPGIGEVVNGLVAPEDENLTRSKERLGIPVDPVPARVSMLPGAATVIRRLAPSSYYRLSGVPWSNAAA